MAGPQRMKTRQGVRLWTIKQAPFLQGSAGMPSWSFDPDAATFTGKMDKRPAPGPFAAAPIVQNKWDFPPSTGSDKITYTPGSQVSGHFWRHGDTDQGSLVVWLTPEQSSPIPTTDFNQTYAAGTQTLRIDYRNEEIDFKNAGTTLSVAFSPVSGNTYCLVLRWDNKNTLDGTNHACGSINDVHHFFCPSVGTVNNPNNPTGVGSSAYGQQGSNAIIEGFTIYRRPLFDGTYGFDAGNGDEINLIHAAGAGKDPAQVTGSWDICIQLPTDGITGEIVTGTGEAWSHPHGSNLLGAGGFMYDGTYTNDGWADELTPSSVAALATAEKIFNGGYKVTGNSGDGIYKDYTCTAGDDFVIRALAHSDGSSIPKVILYDQTNTAEINSLTGTVGSTRTAPDVFIFTGQAPAGCTTLRVKLVNSNAAVNKIAYWHQCELLTNLVNNPGMEGTYTGSGTIFLAPGWAGQGVDDGVDELSKETTIKHNASASQKVSVDGNYEGIKTSASIFASGTWYSVTPWLYATSGSVRIYNESSLHGIVTPSAAWAQYPFVTKGTATKPLMLVTTGGATFYADDVYIIQMSNVSITASPTGKSWCTESAGVRVSGRSTLAQAVSGLSATAGKVSFNYTPRHTSSQFERFNSVSYLFYLHKDNDNYIQIHSESNILLRMDTKVAGVASNSGLYDASALFALETTYLIEIEYSATQITFSVDGDVKITKTRAVDFGVNIPDIFYAGSKTTEGYQIDAVFGAP